MKYQKTDGLKLFYLGLELCVVEKIEHGRGGTMSPSTTEYVLEDGSRVFPVHFAFDYAKISGNQLTWLFREMYPPSLLAKAATNYILKSIRKDDTWKGAPFVIPFKT